MGEFYPNLAADFHAGAVIVAFKRLAGEPTAHGRFVKGDGFHSDQARPRSRGSPFNKSLRTSTRGVPLCAPVSTRRKLTA